MLERPRGLDDADIADALARAWAIEVRDVAYTAVGFGSHHWLADDYFLTVDDARGTKRLEPALRTAFALRHDADLEFVLAPIPSTTGALVVPLHDRWALHVYERLTVVDDTRFGPHDEPAVVDLVRAIHAATPLASGHASREDFSIQDRNDLEEALADVHAPWDTGPYGAPARMLLLEHADDLLRVLATHDRLVAEVPHDGWVVTHGEPHRGNVFRTTRGWAMVDWDTALVAPPERDLWDLPTDLGDPQLKELYGLRWDLTEIAVYISGFHGDHDGDRNDEMAWAGLAEHLDLRNRWPQLL